MKKTCAFVIANMTFMMALIAQQSIELNFTGFYDTIHTPLDSIHIANLSLNEDTMLYYPDTSLLITILGQNESPAYHDGFILFQNFPNPADRQTTIKIYMPQRGLITLKVTDILGREHNSYENNLDPGYHSFLFNPGSANIYIVSAHYRGMTHSIKILNHNPSPTSNPELKYSGAVDNTYRLKYQSTSQGMAFNIGDSLQFTGYYLSITNTLTDTFGVSTDYSFQFQDTAQCPATFIDFRDTTLYHSIQIGKQCWMTENLALLPSVDPPSNSSMTSPLCYVNGYSGTIVSAAKATSNYQTYGALYNWPAAMNGSTSSNTYPSGVKGICPNGWHLPSVAEWDTLISFLGGDTIAGGKMKDTVLWYPPNLGATNSSGFSGLPGGNAISSVGSNGYWHTSTEYDSLGAWYIHLSNNNAGINTSFNSKDNGYSIRCMKDLPLSQLIPKAAFKADTTSITVNGTVQFTDLSINYPSHWQWDFGDGADDSLQNPSHVYDSVGIFTVSLVVSNGYGIDTIVKFNYITVNGQAPVADFIADTTSIEVLDTVFFTDLSSYSPTSWQWDFGDGWGDSLQNPSHVYDTVGTFSVSLVASNSHGTDTMMKLNYITVSDVIAGCPSFFTDIRDSNVYQAMHLGNQCWMKENLAYLPAVSSASSGSTTSPYYYVYGYNGTNVSAAKQTSNYQIYGVLYNWYAAMNGASSSSSNPSGVQGVCPTGWHIPSDAEWQELEIYLGMTPAQANSTGYRGTNQGSQLCGNISLWTSGNLTGNPQFGSSGFTALPGGGRGTNGIFDYMGALGYFWTSTESSIDNTWRRTLYYLNAGVWRDYNANKGNGFSVRCIKD